MTTTYDIPRAEITQEDKDMLEEVATYLQGELPLSRVEREALYARLTDLLDSGKLVITT